MTSFKFEIFEDIEEKYRWRLQVPNGERVAESIAYDTKEELKKNIDLIKKDSSANLNFDTYLDPVGHFRLLLKGADRELVAMGEVRETVEETQEDFKKFINGSSGATVSDLTREIYTGVRAIRKTQKKQEKKSNSSLYLGTLFGLLLGIVGNIFVSLLFQGNIDYLLVIISFVFVVILSMLLLSQSKKYVNG